MRFQVPKMFILDGWIT